MAHGSWLVDNGGSALLPGQGPAPAPMDDGRAGVVWGRLDDAQMSSCFAAASSLQFALAPCTRVSGFQRRLPFHFSEKTGEDVFHLDFQLHACSLQAKNQGTLSHDRHVSGRTLFYILYILLPL